MFSHFGFSGNFFMEIIIDLNDLRDLLENMDDEEFLRINTEEKRIDLYEPLGIKYHTIFNVEYRIYNDPIGLMKVEFNGNVR